MQEDQNEKDALKCTVKVHAFIFPLRLGSCFKILEFKLIGFELEDRFFETTF